MKSAIVSILGLMTLAAGAQAAVVVVRPDFSGDYPTIQTAVEGVQPGDVIELADGIYQGMGFRNISIGKSLTIRSQSGAPQDCIIDCGGEVAFDISEGEVTIQDLTIQSGQRAIDIHPQAKVLLQGCVLRDCQTAITSAGELVAQACALSENRGSETLGAACQTSKPVNFVGCQFSSNTGPFVVTLGGGGSSAFSGCVFEDNEGTALYPQIHSLVINDCRFIGGGDTAIDGWLADVNIEGSEFAGNQAISRDVADLDYGGAIKLFAAGAGSRIVQTSFVSNTAYIGGAIHMGLNGGDADIQECQFLDNSAASVAGLSVYGLGTISIASSTFSGNAAGSVSALGSSSMIRVRSSIFVGNSATRDDGVTISQSTNRGDFEQIIIAFNQGAPFSCNFNGDPRLSCCDIFGNSKGDWVGTCLEWQASFAGNFSQDPQFASWETGDYGLAPSSPCLPGNHPGGEDCGLIGLPGSGGTPVQHTTWGSLKVHPWRE